MKLKRELFAICLVILVLFCVSSVFAADSGENMTSTDMDDVLETGEDDAVIEEEGIEITGDAYSTPFEGLQEMINKGYGSEIKLEDDYREAPFSHDDLIFITQSITIDGQGHTIMSHFGQRIFNITGDNVVIKNIKFIKEREDIFVYEGGAVYWSGSNGVLSDCSFMNWTAMNYGGAVYWSGSNGLVSDCSFVNNTADYGGAVYWSGSDGLVSDCSFVNNTAEWGGGGAVYFKDSINSNVSNCHFVNNNVSYSSGGAIYWDHCTGVLSDCSFMNNSAFRDAAVSWDNCNNFMVSGCCFVNNTAESDCGAISLDFCDNVTVFNCSFVNNTSNDWSCGALYLGYVVNGIVSDCSFVNNTASLDGGALVLWEGDNIIVSNCIFVNNSADNGTIYYKGDRDLKINNNIFLNNNAAPIVKNYTVTANCDYNWFGADETNYMDNPGVEGCDVWLFLKATSSQDTISALSSSDILFKLYAYNSTSPSIVDYDNCLLKYFDLEITQTNGIVDAGITKFGKAVRYTATSGGIGVITASIGSYPIASVNVNVNKLATGLTSKASVTSYNSGKNLVVTLKDSNGNPVRGAKITVDLNGVKTYTTDKNGQIKVPIFKLVPKAYVAKIKFNGNGAYLDSAKEVKVTVNKAKPKITAKAKSFKKSLKVKKYTVTLKTGKSPVKKVKVTLKIGKKTYTAKTNSKGKATFKIKKLSKKGTYKSKVTFKGDKCYKKVTKTVKIKVK